MQSRDITHVEMILDTEILCPEFVGDNGRKVVPNQSDFRRPFDDSLAMSLGYCYDVPKPRIGNACLRGFGESSDHS